MKHLKILFSSSAGIVHEPEQGVLQNASSGADKVVAVRFMGKLDDAGTLFPATNFGMVYKQQRSGVEVNAAIPDQS